MNYVFHDPEKDYVKSAVFPDMGSAIERHAAMESHFDKYIAPAFSHNPELVKKIKEKFMGVRQNYKIYEVHPEAPDDVHEKGLYITYIGNTKSTERLGILPLAESPIYEEYSAARLDAVDLLEQSIELAKEAFPDATEEMKQEIRDALVVARLVAPVDIPETV